MNTPIVAGRYREVFALLKPATVPDDRGGNARSWVVDRTGVRGLKSAMMPPRELVFEHQTQSFEYVKFQLNTLDLPANLRLDWRIRDEEGMEWDLLSKIVQGGTTILIAKDYKQD